MMPPGYADVAKSTGGLTPGGYPLGKPITDVVAAANAGGAASSGTTARTGGDGGGKDAIDDAGDMVGVVTPDAE